MVIDDSGDDFPFDVLRLQGYSIDHWLDVTNLDQLVRGHYDIIVLDILGIGTELDAANQGAGVLTHIKRVNPTQIVIAYSGQSHEASRIPFFRAADEFVPKPANPLLWKETIDSLIIKKLTPAHYWSGLRQLLQLRGVSPRTIAALEQKILSDRPDARELQDYFAEHLGTIENVATLISIASKIGPLLV